MDDAAAVANLAFTFVYPVDLEDLDGEVIARVPAISEVLTGGADRAEALALAKDALEEAVLGRLARGESIPLPTAGASPTDAVFLPPVTAARVLVAETLRARHWTKTRLAEAMGVDEKVVRRILDGENGINMRTVVQALNALGIRSTLHWIG